MIPVMIGVSFIIFSMLHLVPGDPAVMLAGGEMASAEAVEEMRELMGFNDPFFVQYGRWIWNLIRYGDLGTSFVRIGASVIDEITLRFPATFQLAVSAVVVSTVIGIPIGIISATKQYSIFDNIAMFIALLGVSIPNFWMGLLMLLFFSLHLELLPSIGLDSFSHIILPAITLGTGASAMVARMTRSSMLEVIGQDYIRTARAKGQTERVVISKHALKNALIPIITVIGLNFGFLIGGALITERVFTINGLGTLMVGAIGQRDFPIVQGSVLFIALSFSIVNLLVDILYAFVDPRVRSQYR